ncbi:DUF386 domain-containing protein [Acidaminobacter sp. JC074]|uniref:YhcH/YjgK/YiaL family protein n=1 Tax=Acidaminobacter sp. JC074 TaxID=2530199 RepID=UPI001F0D3E53|nr:YhcH/YjgK/YiaL family protein [Acidaminobacter sp. JC074]MCH4887519.1 DUF386 domain-containing protein [Acidaminobacter sp. JC074]
MIFDRLENLNIYKGVHSRFDKVKEFLETEQLENGRYELGGGDYAVVTSYETKEDLDTYEAHNQYLDIQIMMSGKECIFVSDRGSLEAATSYNEADDYILYKGPSKGYINLEADAFAVFFMDDAHMPGGKLDKIEPVKKIIVKLKVEGKS